eukprot:3919519-Amphidinium_carterae.1
MWPVELQHQYECGKQASQCRLTPKGSLACVCLKYPAVFDVGRIPGTSPGELPDSESSMNESKELHWCIGQQFELASCDSFGWYLIVTNCV